MILADLLYQNRPKLVAALKKLPQSIQDFVKSLAINAPLRAVIKSAYVINSYSTQEIDLQKIGNKVLWNKIETALTIFALFQSDP
ncbi:hypothetical protein FCS83_07420 [Oenococcus sp. UCMA 17063]|nr:hypothetical protein [Oenococcus sp. UCMA 17063]